MEIRIIGHERVQKFLETAMASGRLSHAYCLVGCEGLGKRTLAEAVIAELLGIPREKVATHPDVHIVEQTTDEKTGSLKKDIRIEQIEALRGELARHSFFGGYKAVLVIGAEKLNQTSGNALLKTLEEPAGKTIFFFTTDCEEAIPQTIRSRCQSLYFSPVKSDTIVAALLARGATPEQAKEYSSYSLGCPGKALQFLSDPEAFLEEKEEWSRFSALQGKPFHEKLALVESLFGEKGDHTDHVAERGVWSRRLALWGVLAGRAWVDGRRNREETLPMLERIRAAEEEMQHNIHPRLLVEMVLLNTR